MDSKKKDFMDNLENENVQNNGASNGKVGSKNMPEGNARGRKSSRMERAGLRNRNPIKKSSNGFQPVRFKPTQHKRMAPKYVKKENGELRLPSDYKVTNDIFKL